MAKLLITFLLTVLFVAVLLSGCSAVAELPSMKYCQHVKYERAGVDIVVAAECKAPISGGGL